MSDNKSIEDITNAIKSFSLSVSKKNKRKCNIGNRKMGKFYQLDNNPKRCQELINEEGIKEYFMCENKFNQNEDVKENAKRWGDALLRKYTNYSQQALYKCWSGALSEMVVFALLTLTGCKKIKMPKIINGLKPDIETEECIYEVKSRNYNTPGTIGEKILGTPWKYAGVPRLYGKKLIIIVCGYQEVEAIEKFDIFDTQSPERTAQKEYWENLNIHYMKCSELYQRVSSSLETKTS